MDFRRPPEKRMHDDVFEGSTRARRMQDVITKLYKAGLIGLVIESATDCYKTLLTWAA